MKTSIPPAGGAPAGQPVQPGPADEYVFPGKNAILHHTIAGSTGHRLDYKNSP